jgi:hypothetical protein
VCTLRLADSGSPVWSLAVRETCRHLTAPDPLGLGDDVSHNESHKEDQHEYVEKNDYRACGRILFHSTPPSSHSWLCVILCPVGRAVKGGLQWTGDWA